MKRILLASLTLLVFAVLMPIYAQADGLSEVAIEATIRTYVLDSPSPTGEFIRGYERGVDEIAYGRDAGGAWLRILDGWVLAEVFNTVGEIGALPDTTNSILGTTTEIINLYDGPSSRWFEIVSVALEGTRVLVIGRSEDSTWLLTPEGWVDSALVAADGIISLLPAAASPAVIITAKTRTFILSQPELSSEFVEVFEAGEEVRAIGRNRDSSWLEMSKGWVAHEAVVANGNISDLPVSSNHIGIQLTLILAQPLHTGPGYGFEYIGRLERQESISAFGRNAAGSWLHVGSGWINIGSTRSWKNYVETDGDIMSLPIVSSDEVVEKKTSQPAARETPTPTGSLQSANTLRFSLEGLPSLAVRRTPRGKTTVRYFYKGDEGIAYGRDEEGRWIYLGDGWADSRYLKVDGDVMSLPIRTEEGNNLQTNGIAITAKYDRHIRNGPGITHRIIGSFKRNEEANAIGRNVDGSWLLIENGWILAGQPSRHSTYISAEGDVMSLPITDKTATSSSERPDISASLATPTPRPTTSSASGLDARTIRTLVSRHTDDVRILGIEVARNAITIEYDLKPWPFVPNESIANEVAFKIICAIRNGQEIANTLKFVGKSHFKSDVGRKFTSPSVEIHVSARNANRIVCRGNSYSDINWRSLASQYKSYPIPRGASVDYD